MAAIWLMEERDFLTPVNNLSDVELHGQVAWFRSWFASSGSATIEDLQSSLLARRMGLIENIQLHNGLAEAASIDRASLKSAMELISQEIQDSETEQFQLVDMFKQMTITNNLTNGAIATEAHLEQLEAKKHKLVQTYSELSAAFREKAADLDCIYLAHQMMVQDVAVVGDSQAKVGRLQDIENEFKRRNDAAESAAAYLASMLGRDSTYQAPKVPNYIHTTIIPSTGDQFYGADFPFTATGKLEDIWW